MNRCPKCCGNGWYMAMIRIIRVTYNPFLENHGLERKPGIETVQDKRKCELCGGTGKERKDDGPTALVMPSVKLEAKQ